MKRLQLRQFREPKLARARLDHAIALVLNVIESGAKLVEWNDGMYEDVTPLFRSLGCWLRG